MPSGMNLKKIVIIIFLFCILSLFVILERSEQINNNPSENSRRIISLSPSITRAIIDLGAVELLAGVTDYILYPDLKIESVGAYISPNMEKIIRLKPDLVLVSEEDSYIQKLPLLEKFGLRIEVLGLNRDFNSMCENYRRVAAITGMSKTAEVKIAGYRNRISKISRPVNPPRIIFLVSVKPLVTVSGDSHISSIIHDAGGINPFAGADTAYPILSLESLLLSGADAVIIMTMGYDLDINSLLSGYKNVDFIRKGNVFTMGDENIPYYTPEDYTISVEKISSLISMIKR